LLRGLLGGVLKSTEFEFSSSRETGEKTSFLPEDDSESSLSYLEKLIFNFNKGISTGFCLIP